MFATQTQDAPEVNSDVKITGSSGHGTQRLTRQPLRTCALRIVIWELIGFAWLLVNFFKPKSSPAIPLKFFLGECKILKPILCIICLPGFVLVPSLVIRSIPVLCLSMLCLNFIFLLSSWSHIVVIAFVLI